MLKRRGEVEVIICFLSPIFSLEYDYVIIQ